MPDSIEQLCRALVKPRGLYTIKITNDGVFKKKKHQIFFEKTSFDVYIFYTTTSNKFTSDVNMSVCINPSDWDEIELDKFKIECTYLVIDHVNPMSIEEIVSARRQNHFSYKGMLGMIRFTEFQDKFKSVTTSLDVRRVNSDVRKVGDFALLGLQEGEFIEEALKRLKIL